MAKIKKVIHLKTEKEIDEMLSKVFFISFIPSGNFTITPKRVVIGEFKLKRVTISPKIFNQLWQK